MRGKEEQEREEGRDRNLLESECNFIVNLSLSEGKQWSDLRTICPCHTYLLLLHQKVRRNLDDCGAAISSHRIYRADPGPQKELYQYVNESPTATITSLLLHFLSASLSQYISMLYRETDISYAGHIFFEISPRYPVRDIPRLAFSFGATLGKPYSLATFQLRIRHRCALPHLPLSRTRMCCSSCECICCLMMAQLCVLLIVLLIVFVKKYLHCCTRLIRKRTLKYSYVIHLFTLQYIYIYMRANDVMFLVCVCMCIFCVLVFSFFSARYSNVSL